MNTNSHHGSKIGRRDWLKAASLGGAALITGSAVAPASGQESEPHKPQARPVRGIIFMVSDGMSPGVLTMAQNYSKLTRNRGTRWWSLLNDRKAARGLMDTASANSLVTDSAAASSSWGGGQRVNNAVINVSPEGREITPIHAILKKKGVSTGLVSTTSITDATPAGFGASVPNRSMEPEIAEQYLNRVDVILGGGADSFSADKRKDGRDLVGDFKAAGYGHCTDRAGMLVSRDEKLLGLFAPGHLPFTVDRDQSEDLTRSVPTLTEMATAALSRFLEKGKPFLLQVEGARIDHGAHTNDIAALIHDQLAFDDALAAMISQTTGHNDILIIVTSDHGNSNPGLRGMGDTYKESTPCFARIQQMKASNERIFADWTNTAEKSPDNLRSLIQKHLGFMLKTEEAESFIEAFAKHPVVEWNDQLANSEGLLGQFAGNHTGIGWTGISHTSDPTLVSALGPQSDRFTGMVINSDVFGHFMDLLG
ncbi:alkaline phosphatase [Luteolibacter pohnpeiensis]|uniref:Alkaline phosphatase n=1 Tax=Luteolibacter pohnpeiensis TaxID=454153 RepID=A0A934VUY8_9BACT|nr:alkaline phosphatase [Luteolibacter pohnpeiensis]MBK1883027.1 alkaline phosphatase [Luteolibacter pohnpeiensis]